ncbi:MAG: calcium/sodium antiporter [Planctomycetota bacterium]|jgi:cation:H+ antiporter
MLVATLSLFGGLVLLVLASDRLVDGAVAAARRAGVSTLVVGLTVVAYGTSFPEFVVSVIASWRGVGEFAVGNVVGSNVANVALVLGATAAMRAIVVDEPILMRRDLPTLLVATLLAVYGIAGDLLPRFEAFLLFGIAVGYTMLCLRRGEAPAGVEEDDDEDDDEVAGWGQISVLLLVGFGGLALGAHLLVEGGSEVARLLGVPERIIALTIVALGTSLPEMAACIAGAAKGHPELAVGNVVGSNIFNLTFVLGAAGLVRPIPVDFGGMHVELAVMTALTGFLLVSLRWFGGVRRSAGFALVAVYVLYTAHVARALFG